MKTIRPKKIIRLEAVKARTGLSKVSIYNFRKNGTFPCPIKLGARAIGFIEEEIEEWINNRPRTGVSNEKI